MITDPAGGDMMAAMAVVLSSLGPGLEIRRAGHVVVELLQFHGRGRAVAFRECRCGDGSGRGGRELRNASGLGDGERRDGRGGRWRAGELDICC